MPQSPNKLSQFWQELKRRKVIRVITVYAAVAFVIIELVDIVAPNLGLPTWTFNFVLILLCIGFIITVIVSWIYDIHPEGGIVKTEPAYKVKQEDIPKSSNSWKIASYISFVVIVGLIVLNVIPRTGQKKISEVLDKSIAVLPFESLSKDEEQQYQADGVMDAILLHLSKIEDLRVMSRTSVEQYRDTKKTIPEICNELGVAYALEGSFQKSGNQMRLIVQLIQSGKEGHVWANNYDREWKEIFSVQSEVAQLVASEIQSIITPEEQKLIEKIPTPNLTAYDFYQRGRTELENFWSGVADREALERAEDLYYKALEYDSTFALAYAGLAMVYWYSHYRDTYFNKNFMDSLLILADVALSFDNQLSEAYVAKAWYYQGNNRTEQAIIEYDKAIQYNPNEWMAYFGKGNLYYQEDNYLEAIKNHYKAASLYRGPTLPEIYRSLANSFIHTGFRNLCEKYANEAVLLDGDSARYYSLLGTFENNNGNFEDAVDLLERSITIDSTYLRNYLLIGNNYTFLGQFEDALVYYKKLIELRQAMELPAWGSLAGTLRLGQTYLNIGNIEEATYYFNMARDLFKEVYELDRMPRFLSNVGDIHALAGLYASLGDNDKAFEYLRMYYQTQYVPVWIVIQLKVDPLFNSIRVEPEFQQIIADVEAKYQAEHERVRQWLEENNLL